MDKTLLSVAQGQTARIGELRAEGERRGRLLDLGFTPGAPVTFLFSAPSGDPRAYMIRGTVIALRCGDAEGVTLACRGEEHGT